MEVIYGINPIRILLRKPEPGLERIYIVAGRNGAAIQEIIESARKKGIPVEFPTRQYLDDLAGRTDHQGIAGLGHDFVYSSLDNLFVNRNKSFNSDLLVILDSIMDPQNLGSIIRTSYCLGVNGIVIPTDRAAPVTAAVIKASAGSAQLLPIARVTNLSQTLDYLKKKEFWVFGADAHEGRDIAETDFNCNVALVLGGEAKGLRPLVKKKCDFLLSIPLGRHFDSLNVAVAAGIIQYEIFKQLKRARVPSREK